ncbi:MULTISPECIES: hypothetical protein [unclassified Streptomyces]|uniref:hypothetical protein n=1 Tax=unclassified Streptomyces TaxID=2593676 RepID=UPI00382497F0
MLTPLLSRLGDLYGHGGRCAWRSRWWRVCSASGTPSRVLTAVPVAVLPDVTGRVAAASTPARLPC